MNVSARLLLIPILITALSCSKKDDAAPAQKVPTVEPSLSSFAPEAGETGIEVQITGAFPASSTDPAVTFGTVPATIKTNDGTHLIVTVPTTALTGKISVSIGGKELTFDTNFIVKPKITSFTPAQGLAPTVISIQGSGFDPSSVVKFNGTVATPTTISPTQISTPVPVGTTSGFITVTVGDLTSTSTAEFFALEMFAKLEGGSDYDEGYAVVTDATGNVYVAGSFLNQTTVGGGNLTSVGNEDIFIVKYTADLGVIWVRQAGGINADRAISMDIDASGNVYLAGYTSTGATFGTFTAAAGGAFVARLSPAGTFNWLAASGDGTTSLALEVRVVGSNVYTIGSFTSSITFAGQPTLTTTGGEDIFIAKLNAANGSALLVKKYGSTDHSGGGSITADAFGNMYIAGSFFGPLTLGATAMNSVGILDGFVAKLDASGTPVWVRQVGGSSWDNVLSIGLDANGKVYTTGYFTGTANFASESLAAAGNEDIFVAKYDGTTGGVDWVKKFGSTNYDNGLELKIQPDGNILLTGYFSGTVTFGLRDLVANGFDRELFVTQLNASGTPVWAMRAGGTNTDQGSAIAVLDRKIYVTGFIRAASDFGPVSLLPNGQDCIVGRIVY